MSLRCYDYAITPFCRQRRHVSLRRRLFTLVIYYAVYARCPPLAARARDAARLLLAVISMMPRLRCCPRERRHDMPAQLRQAFYRRSDTPMTFIVTMPRCCCRHVTMFVTLRYDAADAAAIAVACRAAALPCCFDAAPPSAMLMRCCFCYARDARYCFAILRCHRCAPCTR